MEGQLLQIMSCGQGHWRNTNFMVKNSAPQNAWNIEPHTHDQTFLDKYNLLVCAKKIDKFLWQVAFFKLLNKALCQGQIVKENVVASTGL